MPKESFLKINLCNKEVLIGISRVFSQNETPADATPAVSPAQRQALIHLATALQTHAVTVCATIQTSTSVDVFISGGI